MKLTKANVEALLKNLGIQDAQIVDDEGDEFNEENIINSIFTPKETVFRQKWETEVLPERLKAEAGKFGGLLKGNIKKLSNGSIKEKDMEGKTDAEVLQLFAEHLQKDKDLSTEEIRTQLKSVTESHAEEIEKIKQEYDGKLSEQSQKFDEINMEAYYTDLVNGLPLMGDDVKVKADTLRNAINAKYKPVWDAEKKAVELRERDNPDKLAIAGDKIIDPKSFAQDYFKGLGMVKTDMSKEKATDHIDKGSGEPSKTDMTNTGLPFQDFEKMFLQNQ